MKTTYQKPTTEMILLNVQHTLCAGSDKPTVGGTTNNVDDLLSRETPSFNVWGDDEEEE